MGGAIDFDTVAMADDTVLLLEESMHELRGSLVCTSLHSSIGGYGDPEPFAPTLDTAPWLSSPRGAGNDELILMADLDVEQSHVDEIVLLCNDDPEYGTVCDDKELLSYSPWHTSARDAGGAATRCEVSMGGSSHSMGQWL